VGNGEVGSVTFETLGLGQPACILLNAKPKWDFSRLINVN